MTKLPKHILVIRLSAMGDVAMAVPVLRAFASQFPQVRLTILTQRFFTPLFRNIPNVEVFSAEINGKHKGVLGLYKLAKELKTLNIDAIADLHNVLRSNILKTFLSRIKTIQINKGRAEKKALMSGRVFEPLKTTHQRYVDVFDKLGYAIGMKHSEFPKPRALSKKILDVIGKEYKDWIGIAPFAQHKGKMYPLHLMEEVVEELSQKYKILLFGGGKSEIKILNELQCKYPNVFNIAGKFSLDEELDIISNLGVMLSMDSGNGHMAAMLGIDVVTIWGVTHPYAGFVPFNQPFENQLLADKGQFPKIPTSVYGNTYPEGYENASASISPQVIIEKVKSLLY